MPSAVRPETPTKAMSNQSFSNSFTAVGDDTDISSVRIRPPGR